MGAVVAETYICPSCGTEARVGQACPGCAPVKRRRKRVRKVAKKSWEQDDSADGLDLPDDDFDYDDFVAKEFGGNPHRRTGISWYWWATGVFLLLVWIWIVMP